MDKRVVYFSRAELKEASSGDCRRLVQVYGVLKKEFHGLELVTINETRLGPFAPKAILMGLKDILFEGSYRLWSKQYRRHVLSLMLRSRIWADSMKKSPQAGLVFVEDPIYFAPFVRRLKSSGIKVIAVCQNIESLSDGQVAPGRQRALLDKEIDILSACSLAVTISREEDLLLNNLGINSIFFPYYPVESVENKLLGLRAERKTNAKRGLLLIGSVANIPTREGMLKVIAFWIDRGYRLTGEKLIVAGFGTEVLRTGSDDGVEVLGTVDDVKLSMLISSIKACLCYQERASGALTKIPEMLIGGVPVIANTTAARSFYNMEGLFEVSSLEEIPAALRGAEYCSELPIPKRPVEAALLSAIRKICS